MENGVSRSSLVHGTQTNPNSDTWYDTDAFMLVSSFSSLHPTRIISLFHFLFKRFSSFCSLSKARIALKISNSYRVPSQCLVTHSTISSLYCLFSPVARDFMGCELKFDQVARARLAASSKNRDASSGFCLDQIALIPTFLLWKLFCLLENWRKYKKNDRTCRSKRKKEEDNRFCAKWCVRAGNLRKSDRNDVKHVILIHRLVLICFEIKSAFRSQSVKANMSFFPKSSQMLSE